MTKSKKVFTVLLIIIVSVLFSLGVTAAGTQAKRQLDAWYGNIKVTVDGQHITGDKEPFIVKGTTYVPLRMLAGIMGRDVLWDPVDYEIKISGDKIADELRQQLAMKDSEISKKDSELTKKDAEILQLQEKITELEKIAGVPEDLGKLEKFLNTEYGKYEGIEFDIALYGDSDQISVRVSVDLEDYAAKWDELTDSDKEEYLEDICDEIRDEYRGADIEGYIKDSSNNDKLHTFIVTSAGSVRLDDVVDLGPLEEDLNSTYSDFFDSFDISINLGRDGDEITYMIEFDYDENEDAWADVTDNSLRIIMSNICVDIMDSFEGYYIKGYIKDEDGNPTLAKFTLSPDGSYGFARYQ